MKRLFALVIAAVLCIGVFAGCSGSGNSSNTSAADTEVVYRMAVTYEESNWDPAFFTQPNDAGLAPMIYENLVELQTDGSVKAQLAEDWSISPDGLVYTFNLRKGVQWHKGYGEFTSADVKFTIERIGDEALGSANGMNMTIDNIKSIECPDKYTVVITLNSVDVDFLTRMSMFYSQIVCKAYSDKEGKDAVNAAPIGTGAFMYDKGTLTLTTEAVANKDWWGDRKGSNIERVINTYIADTNTLYNAFENNELDSIACFDFDQIKKYKDQGYISVSNPARDLLYLGVNMDMAPFDDPKVREAFFCAVDPQYFIDSMYYGTEKIPGSYIPENSKYAINDYFKSTYDVEKCKKLLAEAGYPDGVEITLWGGNDALGAAPVIIASDMLGKAGFKVNTQLVDFGVFIGQVRGGTAQVWCLYNSTGVIADDTMTRYKSEAYPGNNWCGIQDAEYDELVSKGVAASTEEEKAEYFAQAQRRLMDLQAVYPVSTYSQNILFHQGLTGMQTYGDQAFRCTTIVKN